MLPRVTPSIRKEFVKRAKTGSFSQQKSASEPLRDFPGPRLQMVLLR
jgi:hypothetical protein